LGAGVSRISELAGRLQLPANQLTRYLATLQELGLVQREVPVTEPQPARSKRGLYTVADPFLRLWYGCLAPYESALEVGQAKAVEQALKERLARHQAWAFERLCREFMTAHADEWGAMAVGRYWDASVELDVVAVNPAREPVLAGECRFSRQPVGLDTAHALAGKVKQRWPDRAARIKLMLFSTAGFAPPVIRWAGENRAFLIEAAHLTGDARLPWR